MQDDLASLLHSLIACNPDQGIKGHAQHVLTFSPSDDTFPWSLLELVQCLAAHAEFATAEQVLVHLFRMSSDFDYEKALATQSLAASFFAVGQGDAANAWTQRAVQWAANVHENWRQAELLNRIANMLSATHARPVADQIRQRAIAAAQAGEASANPQERIDSASVLWEIVQDLHTSGEHDRARATAHAIQNPGKRQRALESIDL